MKTEEIHTSVLARSHFEALLALAVAVVVYTENVTFKNRHVVSSN